MFPPDLSYNPSTDTLEATNAVGPLTGYNLYQGDGAGGWLFTNHITTTSESFSLSTFSAVGVFNDHVDVMVRAENNGVESADSVPLVIFRSKEQRINTVPVLGAAAAVITAFQKNNLGMQSFKGNIL